MKRLKILVFLVFGISFASTAQYIQVDASYTTQQLVENVLIDNPCASVSNVSVSGLNFGSGNSFGYFTAGTSGFPFADGIILSTGNAESAVGPNSSLLSEGPSAWGGDSDLEDALNVSNSVNATIMEFDFVPLADKISFEYIFSSEQYLTNPSQNQCNYTDGFAFLLRQVNSQDQYQNLAVIPNTNIPVKVNTVRGPGTLCPQANPQYFDAFNTTQHPTNFNGQTVVLTAEATVVPNVTYHIKLVVADQGNNLYDSAIFLGGGSFKVEKNLGPDRLVLTNNPVCDGNTITIDATEPGTNSYQWFKDGSQINGANSPTYTVASPGTYSVEINLGLSGCISTGEIMIEYVSAPAVNSPVTLLQCDPDNNGVSTFNLTLAKNSILVNPSELVDVSYFNSMADASSQANMIQNPGAYENLTTNQVFARIQNSYGCVSYATVDLDIANNTVGPVTVSVCDTDGNLDGSATFNLQSDVTPQVTQGLPAGLSVTYYNSVADAFASSNPITGDYTAGESSVIYARIVNGPDCYGIIDVTLDVDVFDSSILETQTIFTCDPGAVSLSAPAGFQYLWNSGENTQSISVPGAGTYSVSLTDSNGCSGIKNFVVVVSGPPQNIIVAVNDFSGPNNSISITFTGSGDYEFSLDGNFWQQSPVFTAVSSGEYGIFIRDANGCGTVGPIAAIVMDFPKFFTPNGDGFNDIWRIERLDTQPFSTISIFDRYGKLVSSFFGTHGWNGIKDGTQMPASDYWFVLRLESGRIVKSHFALKR